MACLTCSSFDPNYHGGYCDYNRCDTSPSSTCSNEDSRGGNFGSYNCLTCSYFDPNYRNGYCDLHRSSTYPSSSCSNHRY